MLLTFVFTSVAFLAGVHFEDRAKGLGFALLVWFCCTVLYDGMILLVAMAFRDYPLEPVLLGLTVLNPVDLARVLLLLTLDAAALMGYTGAVFGRFFGTPLGIAAAGAALLLWTGAAIPGRAPRLQPEGLLAWSPPRPVRCHSLPPSLVPPPATTFLHFACRHPISW